MSASTETVPCETCGKPTPDSRRCNLCWEVESRLDDYLRGGPAARRFVAQRLEHATIRAGAVGD